MNWDELRFFYAVAKAGSLAQAARDLKVSQPTVSRRIRDLELHLEARLFDRLNQGYELTDLGRVIFEKADHMAEAARGISDRVLAASRSVAGHIRLTASDGLGGHWLMPRLRQLKQIHPDLDVNLLLSIETLNLAEGEADIALRMGHPRDENLVGKQVANVPFHLYGSNSYFRERPMPRAVEDLSSHLLIESTGRLENLPQNVALRERANAAEVSVACDQLNAQVRAAEAGMGLVPLPPYLVSRGSDLLRVPETVFEVCVPVWLLTRQDLRNCRRVVAMKQFLLEAAERTLVRPAGLGLAQVA